MVKQNGNIVWMMRLVAVIIRYFDPTINQKLLNLKREGLKTNKKWNFSSCTRKLSGLSNKKQYCGCVLYQRDLNVECFYLSLFLPNKILRTRLE